MRLIPAVLLSATMFLQPAQAATIDYEGAQALEKKLTTYLPPDMAASGLVKVRPGTDDYEITFDPMVLLKKVDPKNFSITGLKPLLSLVRPTDNGLWQFSQKADLDVKGTFAVGPEKSDFSGRIDALTSNGLIDPDLLYFRSAVMSANGLSITSTSPQQSMDIQYGAMKATIDSKKATANTIDIRSNTIASDFSEKVTSRDQPPVDISAVAVTQDMALNGLSYQSVQELIFFVLDRTKTERLTPEDQTKLKALARANLPMFDTLAQNSEFTSPKVVTPNGTFNADAVRFTVSTNGLRDGASVGMGFAIDRPSVPAGVIPAAFVAALPETVNMQVSLDDLNLASGIGYFLDHADFNAVKTLTDEQSKELGGRFLSGGALTINYEDISAKSSVYDFSVSGTTTIYPEQPGRQNTDVTIYARNFDSTVSYLQKNAQAVPEFGQAAFVLLMVKGFAKQGPDGQQMWNVTVDENRHIQINGQDLPFQP